MKNTHTLKQLPTKPRESYICTECFLKFARPTESTCNPTSKDVAQRKQMYLRMNGVAKTNTFLFPKRTEKKAN